MINVTDRSSSQTIGQTVVENHSIAGESVRQTHSLFRKANTFGNSSPKTIVSNVSGRTTSATATNSAASAENPWSCRSGSIDLSAPLPPIAAAIIPSLEIKREFTVGHFATFRSGALPVIAAVGGIVLPAVMYALIAPPGVRHGWGIPIGTDTAFAVALIVLLGSRVPIELRVFLTAAVIIDDIVAIAVIALFYSSEILIGYLITGCAVTVLLVVLNRSAVYGTLPYALCGIALWFVLHEAGLHATLAGVILAVLIPARPPANLNALLAQASMVILWPKPKVYE